MLTLDEKTIGSLELFDPPCKQRVGESVATVRFGPIPNPFWNRNELVQLGLRGNYSGCFGSCSDHWQSKDIY